MQISSRLNIALHAFVCAGAFQVTHKMISDFLANNIQTNPVIIRNILSQLRRAGLVRITRGTGGATLERALKGISFYDVYVAIELVEHGVLFRFHENSNPSCPVGKNIHAILDDEFSDIQRTMEAEVRKYTLEDTHRDLLRLNVLQEVSPSV